MKFGLFSSAQANSSDLGPETGQGFRDYLDFNVEAEALGFTSSFLVEHHFTGWNQVSSTLMLLMALAMRTKTLRLGSAVMVLPWHNPVLLAEQAATLDLVSGGRFDFGIGKGYRHSEFKGFQIAPEEAEARFEEAVEVMTRALTHARTLFASRPLLAFRGHRRRAAAGATAASAVLGRRRQRDLDPPRRRARLQSDPRSICQRGANRASASGSTKPSARRAACPSIRCRSRWRASFMSPRTRPTSKPRWCARPPIPSAPSMCRAQPGRQERLACAGLCRQGRRHRGERAVRHAGRDLRDARSGARRGRRLCPAHHLRRQRAVAPFRARDHAGLCTFRRPRPTPRNDGAHDGRQSQTARCQGGRAGDPAGRSATARRSKWSAAAASAPSAAPRNGTRRSIFRRFPASRFTSPRNSCSRPRPERRLPKSKRWWRRATRNSPSSRWITGRCWAARPAPARIGGAIAANLSGPRRIKAGAARDHFLGVSAVSGRGETFKSGGRVVKNVTGYDLCKLIAGSWGTLAAMTDVTIKTLPRAETEATILVLNLDDATARKVMAAAMGSFADVSAAAHLPAAVAARIAEIASCANCGDGVPSRRRRAFGGAAQNRAGEAAGAVRIARPRSAKRRRARCGGRSAMSTPFAANGACRQARSVAHFDRADARRRRRRGARPLTAGCRSALRLGRRP